METFFDTAAQWLIPLLWALLIIIGYWFMYGGYTTLSFYFAFLKRGQTTIGRVISIRLETGSEGERYEYPTLAYQINDRTYQKEVKPLFIYTAIGEEMVLRYLPEKPEEIWANTPCTGIIWGFVQVAIGLAIEAIILIKIFDVV